MSNKSKVTHSTEDVEFSTKELAAIVGLSIRRIGQLVEEKVITRLAPNRYGLSAITQYLNFLRSGGGGQLDLQQERARLTILQQRKAKVELAALEGRYVESAEADEKWGRIALTIRSKFLAMPAKLAPQLEHQPVAECFQLLEDEIEEVLTELAGGSSTLPKL